MTRDGDYLWYADLNRNYIGKTNTTGDSLFYSFEQPNHETRGVTWDGTHLWTINTSGTIKQFTETGVLVDSVSGLLTEGWGLTFDGTFFWAVSNETNKIYQLSLLDHEPPTSPVVACPSHPLDTVWYSDPEPVFQWTEATDPMGIRGYSYILDHYEDTIPDDTINGTETTVTYESVEDGVWYFHCRAADMSGNWSEVDHLKLLIDATPPSSGTILVAAGADTVSTLIVTLDDLGAVDDHSGMGPGAAMRFSNNIVSWSEEEPFSASRADWDLSQYEGNTLSGLKRIYAFFRDAAGNWSVAYSDDVVYNAPLIIVTDSLAPGTVGYAYDGMLLATGGWPPYQWELSEGDLPPDLILDPDGIVSGVPESEGSYTFTVKVTDDNMYSTTSVFHMSVSSNAVTGDVNGDGVVNVLDLITIVLYILDQKTFTPSQVQAADLVTDGTINVLDAVDLANMILNQPTTRAIPSPGQGGTRQAP